MYRNPSPPSEDTSSPILIIAILGITITAFLLVSYYIFVIKCWVNCVHMGFFRHIVSSTTRDYEDPFTFYERTENRGVDESVIQAIPIFRFKKEDKASLERSYFECAVCLNEFQDEEKLRLLPSCTHVFHIDCIDIWLQSNANCPLCRSSISDRPRVSPNQMIVPTSSPQDPTPFTETIGGDEDFVVIEVTNEVNAEHQTSHRRQESVKSGEISGKTMNPSPKKLRQKKHTKFHHGTSMGDECIDIRVEDDQFSVQPIRRSFSMDSSIDRQLFLAVQDIIQQTSAVNEISIGEGCSSRVRRSIFSFGHNIESRHFEH
ncbi:RING-type E3 ubiquitin transferase [Ranunculus cassubicifolius]